MAERPLRLVGIGDVGSLNFLRWARRLAARGHEVHAVSGRVNSRPEEAKGIHVHLLKDADPLLRVPGLRRLRMTPTLARVVREIDPDVVHVHYLLPYGSWAARAGLRPLVVSPWGTDALVDGRPGAPGHARAREAIQAADRIVLNSRALAQAVAELGAPADCVRYVLWHADLDEFGPEKRRRDDDDFVILSLRNFRPDTHIDTLVRAFARVRVEEPNARLVLAARRGPLRDEVERLVGELGLSHAVEFVFVSPAELPALVASGDVVVTLSDSDSSPPSLLEAMASALPVVATPAASIEEWVHQDNGAELVPHGDEEAVAAALLKLARDPERRRAYGERNRRVVLDAYGDPGAELERIYAEVIER